MKFKNVNEQCLTAVILMIVAITYLFAVCVQIPDLREAPALDQALWISPYVLLMIASVVLIFAKIEK